jgi:hypothetical protein
LGARKSLEEFSAPPPVPRFSRSPFRETIETVSPCAIPTLSPQIFSPARNDIFFGSFAALCIVYIDRFGSWLCKNAMLRKTHRMDFHQTAINGGEILKRCRI